jgi:hypothetical protein
MEKLILDMTYDPKTDDFDVSGNVENPIEFAANFIRTQMGAGVDHSPAADLPVFHIQLELDLSFDSWSVRHDCGNKGLRDGIILRFISSYRK